MNTKLICFCLIAISCSGGCETISDQERILSTSRLVISAILKNDAHKFESLMGRGLKTFEMIEYDVNRLHSLFNAESVDSSYAEVIITNLFDDLGRRLIRIPIKPNDSTTLGIRLNLYFGPPEMMPLDKTSGYEIMDGGRDPYEFREINSSSR